MALVDPAVHLRGAVSLLGRFPALAGVDLDVAPGEIVLLQGPNGAGKTTLLRACAGLVEVARGEATVLGVDLRRDRRSVRRRVGLLGHRGFLYDDLTVVENVRFAVRAGGGGQELVDEAIEQLGLGGRLAGVLVGRLSAGQRRRTAIAAVVARRPELWLLDEPHAGLDAPGRDVLDGIVRRAVAAGATVLFASHELDRATALAGRVVTIAGGRVHAPRVREPVGVA
jgi:heme ABC exporter ATP-binding subunit CcmA